MRLQIPQTRTGWHLFIVPRNARADVCKYGGVLTLATIGMFAYGAYSAVWAIADVVHGARIELWAEALIALVGLLLILAAAFVRVRMPGGLAVAIGAMLALQALEVHTAAHLESGLAPQIGRAVLAFFLVGSAVADDARQRRP